MTTKQLIGRLPKRIHPCSGDLAFAAESMSNTHTDAAELNPVVASLSNSRSDGVGQERNLK